MILLRIDAQFLLELSKFDGLFTDTEKRPIDKVQAMITYVRDYYFKELMASGYHVLHTIPVWKKGSELPLYALTDLLFHVYCETEVTRQTFTSQSRSKEPVMMIMGMTGNRPLPAVNLKLSANWIARAGRLCQFGTVCVSADILLKSRLLRLLSDVNAITTMIPVFAGVNGDNWNLELVPWYEHNLRRLQPSTFVLCNDRSLQYAWYHQESWTYEHLGSMFSSKELYTVSCAWFFALPVKSYLIDAVSGITENFLEIPTTFKQGMTEIKLSGSVKLSVGFIGADTMTSPWR